VDEGAKNNYVMVMASTVHDFGKTKKSTNRPNSDMLECLLDNLKGQTVGEKVSENIKYDSVVKTDNYRSYSKNQR